jgi:hypothetical protein
MYLAATPTAALLETVFHDVHDAGGNVIYERDLRGKLLAHVRAPALAALADLRDSELDRLGLHRSAVVTSPAEHYPCTRRLAIAALAQPRRGRPVQGLIWHSRQAELARADPVEVIVLFGGARYPSGRGSWAPFGAGASSLYNGPGRLLIDEIAENLGHHRTRRHLSDTPTGPAHGETIRRSTDVPRISRRASHCDDVFSTGALDRRRHERHRCPP